MTAMCLITGSGIAIRSMTTSFDTLAADQANALSPTSRRWGDRSREEDGRGVSFVNRLFGKRSADSAPPADADTEFDRIGAFLRANQLSPTPDNYNIAWEYMTAPHGPLGRAVGAIIEREGRLDASAATALLTQYRAQDSAEDLAEMLTRAQGFLSDGTDLIERARVDAKAYGSALSNEMAEIDRTGQTASTISALASLTSTMIQKAADAEKQLRDASQQMADMQSRLSHAEKLAESDALTGLANRRAFERLLRTAISESEHDRTPLSVAFCDIDHFKRVNDTHGHATGDRVLKFVAGLLSRISNGNCHVARHGGEEFVILLKGRNAREAQRIVDKARVDLTEHHLTSRETRQQIGQISFSAGIADLQRGEEPSGLLHRADRALYRAKQDGRNRVYF